MVLGLRLVGDGGDRFDRHAQQCGDLLRAFAHGLQLVDLHRISLLLWLAELYRLGGLLRLLLRRRVPWVDRRLLIPLIRGLRGLLGSVLLLRVVLLGLLHGRLLWSLLDRLLGLASVDEIVDAGSGFDVEFEHLRRLGRVAPRAETHEPFRDGVARLRDLHARLTAGLAKRLELDAPALDPERAAAVVVIHARVAQLGLDDDVDLLLRASVVPKGGLLGLEVVDLRGLDFFDDAGHRVSGLAVRAEVRFGAVAGEQVAERAQLGGLSLGLLVAVTLLRVDAVLLWLSEHCRVPFVVFLLGELVFGFEQVHELQPLVRHFGPCLFVEFGERGRVRPRVAVEAMPRAVW